MNDVTNYLDLIYDYLKKLNQKCSFEDIWYAISKDVAISPDQTKEDVIGEIYTDLVLDNRFVLTSDGLWGLREFLKFDDIKKQYDYVDKFESTHEFDDMDVSEFEDFDKSTVEYEDDISVDEYDGDYENEEDEYGDGDIPTEEFIDDLASDALAKKIGIHHDIDWDKDDDD